MANFDRHLDDELDLDAWIVDCEERVHLLQGELAEARAMLDRAKAAQMGRYPRPHESFDDDPLLRDPSPGVDPRMFDQGTDISGERL